MKNIATQFAAATGSCAIVAAAAIGVMAANGAQQTGITAEPASTGVTQTSQVAPPEPEISKAVPQITGPAPLPQEEQGVPG